jgi:L-fuconolactonase
MGAHHQLRRVAADEQCSRTAVRGAIDRDYGSQDLAPEPARSSVDATVVMQSIAGAAEINQVADDAASIPAMAGVVGWPPLQDSPAARRWLERTADPTWCGVGCRGARYPMQRLATPEAIDFVGDGAVRGLAWDVARIAVGHLAGPPLETGGWQPWAGTAERWYGLTGQASAVGS